MEPVRAWCRAFVLRADWGWLQHIAASLNDSGRAAVVLDTGAVSRGSGSKSSNKEKTIRQAFVEADLVECVILLPDNLFYNTPSPGIIVVLNRNKVGERKNRILVVNASAYFLKEKPKNKLTDEGIAVVSSVVHSWTDSDGISKVVTLEQVREADYNLNPSLFVESIQSVTHRPLAEITRSLLELRKQRELADAELDALLGQIFPAVRG